MECHPCSHPFSCATKLIASMHRQITLLRCHRKTTAKADFTGKYGWPFSDQVEKSFGSFLATNCTFGKEYWRRLIFKLYQSCSKSGNFIWRCCHGIMTKYSFPLYRASFSHNLVPASCDETPPVSFIRIKAPFLKKCATLPSAFSEWAFSDNVARRRFLVLSHL